MNRTRSLVAWLVLLCAPATAVGQTAPAMPTLPDVSASQKQIDGWEDAVSRFEELDRQQPDPPGAVILLGSSSIRLWKSAAEDLAPYPVIPRGYGGARFSDYAYYAERIITPHEFRAAVVFVGNDILGRDDDKTPEQMEALFGYIADVIAAHQPDAQVVCVDVRPCPSRWGAWDKIRAGNDALRAACDARPNVHYLDTSDAYLTADGAGARADLYGPDRLHLNDKGYELWSSQIKAKLDEVLGE